MATMQMLGTDKHGLLFANYGDLLELELPR